MAIEPTTEQLQQQLQHAQQVKDRLKSNLYKLKSKIIDTSTLVGLYSTLKEENAALVRERNELVRQLEQERKTIANLRAQLELVVHESLPLRNEYTTASKQLDTIRAQLSTLETEYLSMKAYNVQLRADLEKLQDFKREHEQMEGTVHRLKRELAQKDNRIKQLQRANATLSAQLEAAEAKIQQSKQPVNAHIPHISPVIKPETQSAQDSDHEEWITYDDACIHATPLSSSSYEDTVQSTVQVTEQTTKETTIEEDSESSEEEDEEAFSSELLSDITIEIEKGLAATSRDTADETNPPAQVASAIEATSIIPPTAPLPQIASITTDMPLTAVPSTPHKTTTQLHDDEHYYYSDIQRRLEAMTSAIAVDLKDDSIESPDKLFASIPSSVSQSSSLHSTALLEIPSQPLPKRQSPRKRQRDTAPATTEEPSSAKRQRKALDNTPVGVDMSTPNAAPTTAGEQSQPMAVEPPKAQSANETRTRNAEPRKQAPVAVAMATEALLPPVSKEPASSVPKSTTDDRIVQHQKPLQKSTNGEVERHTQPADSSSQPTTAVQPRNATLPQQPHSAPLPPSQFASTPLSATNRTTIIPATLPTTTLIPKTTDTPTVRAGSNATTTCDTATLLNAGGSSESPAAQKRQHPIVETAPMLANERRSQVTINSAVKMLPFDHHRVRAMVETSFADALELLSKTTGPDVVDESTLVQFLFSELLATTSQAEVSCNRHPTDSLYSATSSSSRRAKGRFEGTIALVCHLRNKRNGNWFDALMRRIAVDLITRRGDAEGKGARMCFAFVRICRQFADTPRVRVMCFDLLRERRDAFALECVLVIAEHWPEALIGDRVIGGDVMVRAFEIAVVSIITKCYPNAEDAEGVATRFRMLLGWATVLPASGKDVPEITCLPFVEEMLAKTKAECAKEDSLTHHQTRFSPGLAALLRAVEVVAAQQQWAWVYNQIILARVWPLLADVLKKGPVGIPAMRLIGRLSRNTNGTLVQQSRVQEDELPGLEELRKRLSGILTTFAKQAQYGFPFAVQVAAAQALLDMSLGKPDKLKVVRDWVDALKPLQRSWLPEVLVMHLQPLSSRATAGATTSSRRE